MPNITSVLQKHSSKLLHGMGAEEEKIIDAETKLGVSFCPDFRACLKEYSVFAYEGHEFTGITDDPRINIVTVTEKYRGLDPSIPANWYVIEETNIDGITVWQAPDGKLYFIQITVPPLPAAKTLSEFLHIEDS